MTKSRDARRFEQIMKTLNSERRDQVFKAAIAAMIDIRSQGDALSDVFGLIDVIAALMARGSRGWESKPAEIGPEDFDVHRGNDRSAHRYQRTRLRACARPLSPASDRAPWVTASISKFGRENT
jgi:hypothetical protein